MDIYDFQVHLRLCLASENVDNGLKVMLAGYGQKSKSSPVYRGGKTKTWQENRKFDPATGKWEEKAAAPDKIYQKVDLNKGMLIGSNKKKQEN